LTKALPFAFVNSSSNIGQKPPSGEDGINSKGRSLHAFTKSPDGKIEIVA